MKKIWKHRFWTSVDFGWNDPHDFGNFEEPLCQGKLFDTKTFMKTFSFIIWLFEDMKVLKIWCSIRNNKMFSVLDTYFLYLQKIKQWNKKRFVVKALGQIHPSNNRFRFLCQIAILGTGTLQGSQSLCNCPICNKFFIYR